MKKAFSETVVQSSVDDFNSSSEEEEGPQQLLGKDLKECLNNIPSFSGSKFSTTTGRVENGNQF